MPTKIHRQTPNSTAVIVDGEGLNPVGAIIMWAGSSASRTIPSGWLPCDGAAISRTTYADLFAVIGTTYGVGNGSTTFNLPITLGSTPGGIALTANTRSTSLAGATSSASHTHNATSGGHSANHTHNGTSGPVGDHTHNWDATSGNNSANHTHDVTLNPGEAGNADTTKTTTNQSANHTHNFNVTSGDISANHTHDTPFGNQSADHTHNTTTGNQSVSHTHALAALSFTYLIKL